MTNYLKNLLVVISIFIFAGICFSEDNTASNDTTIANRESFEIAKAITGQDKTTSNQQNTSVVQSSGVSQAVTTTSQTPAKANTVSSQEKIKTTKTSIGTKKKKPFVQETAPIVQEVVPVVQPSTTPVLVKSQVAQEKPSDFDKKNEDDVLFEAFLIMAKRGDVSGLEFFLSRGLDINKKYSDTAVILEAAKNNKLEAVDYISQNKCNLDVTNNQSFTALRYAVENGNDEMVKLLLDAKCDPNIQDKETMKTPLMVSLEKRLFKIVALLLNSKKINVNLTDKEGKNSLMIAIACSNLNAVEKIIDRKANVFAVDSNGKSVLDIAKSNGDEEIIKIIKRDIAKKEAEQLALEKKANKKKKSKE
jgi:ankyrin repeat protein